MRYHLYGNTGLRISPVCLGTLGFGSAGADGVEPATARAIFDRFAEGGGNFIDTAHGYGDGRSEQTLADLISADRDHFVLATKYSSETASGSVVLAGNSRKNMRRSVHESLRRLKTDYVDILHLHMWDFTTGWPEILSGLHDLVSAGLVNYVAVSNVPAWEISRADTMADLRGWTRLAGVQIKYSIVDRSPERELLPMAAELGLAVTAYSPLGGGVVSQRAGSSDRTKRGWPIPERARAIADRVCDVADRLGCSPSQVALSWMMSNPRWGRPTVPIVGATEVSHVTEALAAADMPLGEADRAELNAVSAIDVGYPYDRLFGGTFRSAVTARHPDALVDTRPSWGFEFVEADPEAATDTLPDWQASSPGA